MRSAFGIELQACDPEVYITHIRQCAEVWTEDIGNEPLDDDEDDEELAEAMRVLIVDEEFGIYKYVEDLVDRKDLTRQERARHYPLVRSHAIRYLTALHEHSPASVCAGQSYKNSGTPMLWFADMVASQFPFINFNAVD